MGIALWHDLAKLSMSQPRYPKKGDEFASDSTQLFPLTVVPLSIGVWQVRLVNHSSHRTEYSLLDYVDLPDPRFQGRLWVLVTFGMW